MTNAKTIIFDLGETLVDETRQWEVVAQAAGVPSFTLAAILGSVIERGLPHHAVFDELGIDPIHAVDHGYVVTTEVFYEDAIPTLHALRAAGYRLGIVANQPAGVVEQLEAMDLHMDIVATSASIGVSKPDSAFFHHIANLCGVPPEQIVYVGDRLDNDVLPAQSIGMKAIFIRRGPWAYIQARTTSADQVRYRIESLDALPAIMDQINAAT